LPDFQLPQDVPLIGYKKVKGDVILKLEIPKESPRTACLSSRKCRAKSAKVLAYWDDSIKDWSTQPMIFYSMYNNRFEYPVGRLVTVEYYNPDPNLECTTGIHFFEAWSDAIRFVL
jgi:hypothetical protein